MLEEVNFKNTKISKRGFPSREFFSEVECDGLLGKVLLAFTDYPFAVKRIVSPSCSGGIFEDKNYFCNK